MNSATCAGLSIDMSAIKVSPLDEQNESRNGVGAPNEWSARNRPGWAFFLDSDSLVAQSQTGKKRSFFVAPAARIFAKSPKIRFERPAAPTSPRAPPFKKFSKK
jgi:hypothetical protein